jgi:hypothetical protein
MAAVFAIADMNDEASAFWEIRTARVKEQMTDKALRDNAFETLNSELMRGIPAYYQTTLESALLDAEDKRIRYSKNFGQKGGKAKKTDALQQLILKFVRNEPDISVKTLEERITAEERLGIIEDVTDGEIHFVNHNSRSKSAALSGLKHRLSRVRKTIQNS